MALVDATGTGLFIAGSAVYFVQVVHLTPGQVGLGLALAGLVGVVTTVPLGMLGDRIGARRLLVALSTLRVAGFIGYVFVSTPVQFMLLAAVLGSADSAVPPLNQAVVGLAVDAARRVRVMGVQRAVRNVGFTLGAGLAAVALAVGTRRVYDAVFLVDAASFVVVAVVVARLPLRDAGIRSRCRSGRRAGPRNGARRYDRLTLCTTVLNGAVSVHMTLLGVGIPLWLIRHTDAPAALVGVLIAINTVMAVLLQVRFTRSTDTLQGGARALRRAGLSLAICCLLLGVAGAVSRGQAVVLLMAAVIALTLGELWQAAGGWSLSFALAPEGRQGEILALFGTGTSLQQVIAPPLLTVVVFRAGLAGWIALGAAVALSGSLTVPITTRQPASRAAS
jgi:MFS family permease